MVPMPVATPMVAFVAAVSETFSVSSLSRARSPRTATGSVRDVSPGTNTTEPVSARKSTPAVADAPSTS
jgi:hypothetical protein